MKLLLDDKRKPEDVAILQNKGIYMQDDWEVVRDYEAFKAYIENNPMPEIISFDHDLTWEHSSSVPMSYIPYYQFSTETGYHCLLWLILFCDRNHVSFPRIMIHTLNAEGQNNLLNLVDAYKLICKE